LIYRLFYLQPFIHLILSGFQSFTCRSDLDDGEYL